MIKNRFIWRRKHQVFVFKGCGGSSVDIALWFQSTTSSLNLWKLIISFQQYFVSELYSSFEIILLSKITSLGALHMLLCLTRCPLTKHQACCEMLVRAHLKRPIASVWHFFVANSLPPTGQTLQDIPLSSCSAKSSYLFWAVPSVLSPRLVWSRLSNRAPW